MTADSFGMQGKIQMTARKRSETKLPGEYELGLHREPQRVAEGQPAVRPGLERAALVTHYLGIDPGLDGALALYAPGALEVLPMPTHTITVNQKKKRALDLAALATWFDLNRNRVRHAVIENPSAMPGQGVTSSFNFGFNCGVMQSMVAASVIPYTLVRPAVWKREMGLTADKDATRRTASQLMPAFAHLWPRVKDDGIAEAALLALYASKVVKFAT